MWKKFAAMIILKIFGYEFKISFYLIMESYKGSNDVQQIVQYHKYNSYELNVMYSEYLQ